LTWLNRQRARRRREEVGLEWTEGDSEPDFSTLTFEDLPERLKGELADVMGVTVDQLEVVDAEQRRELVGFVRYRDRESDREHTAELGRSDVVFKRVGAKPPELLEASEPQPRRGLRGLFRR
jgi:hypothetical protein